MGLSNVEITEIERIGIGVYSMRNIALVFKILDLYLVGYLVVEPFYGDKAELDANVNLKSAATLPENCKKMFNYRRIKLQIH